MPLTHDTIQDQEKHRVFQQNDWSKEIVPRLPQQWEEQAEKLHAMQRHRGIRSASDLLRGVLASVFVTHSFTHLGIWSVLMGVADISANAWRKRVRTASAWLDWLLAELLAMVEPTSPWLLRSGLRRVLLIDGTHWKAFGPHGMVWRVHTAFDLLAGRLTQVKVTDEKQGERLDVFDLHPGDLVVTDRANGLRERIVFVLSTGAHIIVRIAPRLFPMEDEQGRKIDVLAWLKGLHAQAGEVVSRTVWITWARQRIQLRLSVLRLSREQQEKAQRRLKRRGQKKQEKVHPNTLFFSGWVIVVTTLPRQTFSDQQVMRLYQARWHIELLFKRIKQLLNVSCLRSKTAATVKPTLTALLIGWALLEEESAVARLAIHDAMGCLQQVKEGNRLSKDVPQTSCWSDDASSPLSEWMLAEASFDLFCQQVRGCYTAQRFRQCLPRLRRFLCPSHRDRPHLYSLVSRWLRTPEQTLQEGVA